MATEGGLTVLWWQWVVLALVLAVAEILTPGIFVLLFFAIGALVVGGLTFLGLGGPPWLQWLEFSIFSVLSLVVFRSRLVRRLIPAPGALPHVNSMVGELATPVADIAPGAVGQAELRGTVWTARNGDAAPILRGQRCRVSALAGLELTIRAEGGV